ncbi:MAG: ATP-grasp domain-containing protein, partial [Clostridia bacterium]|nr:ATP-grasp domain-containing protein [Clostridia bacterium]
MKCGWLIYSHYESQRNSFFIDQLNKSAKEFCVDLKLLIRETLTLNTIDGKLKVYCDNTPLETPDFALVRINDFTLSYQLEQMGVKVFNSSQTSLICNDKYLTYCFANQLNIPTLSTTLVDKSCPNWQEVTKEQVFPLVIKPVNLKGGEKVFLVKDEQEFLQKSTCYGEKFLLQQPSKKLGLDVRVYVLDKKILACVERKSTTDFRSNFCLGGSAKIVQPTTTQIDVVNKITQNLDCHYVGIDFLFDDDKIYLNEIEDVVGART